MGDPLAGWACKGRTHSAWGENLAYRLLASHFYFASATAGTGWGWLAAGGDECGDASVVGIRVRWVVGLGGWEMGRRIIAGLKKFGALAAMVRRRACTCFAFMLPKNQVGAVDRLVRNRGDTARSPTRESRLDFFGPAHA
jgi:hypothetical protein